MGTSGEKLWYQNSPHLGLMAFLWQVGASFCLRVACLRAQGDTNRFIGTAGPQPPGLELNRSKGTGRFVQVTQ